MHRFHNLFLRQLDDFENKEMQVQEKEVDSKIASQPVGTLPLRQQLHEKLNSFFSDYAKTILWEEKQVGKIKTLEESDPLSIKITKYALMILQEIEKILDQFSQPSSAEQKKRGTRSAFSPPLTAEEEEKITLLERLYDDASYHVSAFAKTSVRPFVFLYGKISGGTAKIAGISSKVAFATPAVVRICSHLGSMVQVVQEAGIVKRMPAVFDSVIQLISQNFAVATTSGQVETYIKSNFNELPELFYDLIISSMSINRPVAPGRSEQQQVASGEVDLQVVDQKPDFARLPANCYVLVKEARGDTLWQLFQVQEGRSNYEIEIKLTDVPGLPALLYDKETIYELDKKEKSAIKANLPKRWNASVQERSEWLPLVEFARIGIVGTDILSTFLNHHAEKVTKDKGALDAGRAKLIEKTQKALKDTIDAEGYYKYGEEETVLSRSLKGIFNVIWSINQLSRGYWETNLVAANVQMALYGKKAYDHYWKIQWPEMGAELGEFSQQIIDGFLIYSKDIVYSRLQNIADYSHVIELQHHLCYGALSRPLRLYFDPIENMYHERGLPGGNPFGYTKKQEIELKRALREAEENQSNIQRRAERVEEAIVHYQKCVAVKSATDNQLLLSHLATFRQELAAEEIEDAKAFEALQDALIVSLSSQEKQCCRMAFSEKKDPISLSILSKLSEEPSNKSAKKQKKRWFSSFSRAKRTKPLTEEEMVKLQSVIKIGKKIKGHLQEERCKVAKYNEALAQHRKMRTEFVLRQLRQDGLLFLMDAVRKGCDPAHNIKQKRRLATLLADINEEDRGPYLQDAHTKATEFINDPIRIKQFVTAIYVIDPPLGHIIALETYLAGYITEPEEKQLETVNPYEDLCSLLDRMPAEHVFRIVPVSSFNESAARTAVTAVTLLTIIQQEKLDSDSFDGNRESIFEKGLSKKDLMIALVQTYEKQQAKLKRRSPPSKLMASSSDSERKKEEKETAHWTLSQPETRLMNKIGLFMGRLAHADYDMAKIVFGHTSGCSILYNECVVRKAQGELRSDRALYYESLVQTFEFNYTKGKYYEENRSYQQFLTANQSTVIAIYRVSDPDSTETEETILARCQQDVWAFCLVTETFIKHNVSSNSQAEKRLREFFSALVLCFNNDETRKRMLQRHEKTRGSKHARYIELLTNTASEKFWPKAKGILCAPAFLQTACQPLERKKTELRKVVQDKEFDAAVTSEDAMQDLYAKFDLFVNERKRELRKKVAELKQVETDLHIKCQVFQGEIKAAEDEAEERLQKLRTKINQRHKDQARLIELNKKLIKIIGILTVYSEDNSSVLANVQCFFGEKLPYRQQQMVNVHLQKFKESQEKLYRVDGDSADELEKEVKKTVETLVGEHASMVHACQEKKDNKKSLTSKVTIIKTLSSAEEIEKLPLECSLGIEEALQRDITFIERIVQTLRAVSDYLCSFFENDAGKLNSTEQRDRLHPPASLEQKELSENSRPLPLRQGERRTSV